MVGLDRGWSRDAPSQPPANPALLYTIAGLEEQLKGAYKLVTEGKFGEGHKAFLKMLHIIPLLVVEGRKEVDEVRGRPAGRGQPGASRQVSDKASIRVPAPSLTCAICPASVHGVVPAPCSPFLALAPLPLLPTHPHPPGFLHLPPIL